MYCVVHVIVTGYRTDLTMKELCGHMLRRRVATKSCFLRKIKEEESRLIVIDFNLTEPSFQRAETPFYFQLQRSCC
jgi:hypothetical protein